MIFQDISDNSVLIEIGLRISRYRLNKNMRQEDLAQESGVSKPTIQRVENGESIQSKKLIRILRALGLLENIELLLPAIPVSPIQQLKLHGKARKRATSPVYKKSNSQQPWTWSKDK